MISAYESLLKTNLLSSKQIDESSRQMDCKVPMDAIFYGKFNAQIEHILQCGNYRIMPRIPKIYVDQWFIIFRLIKPLIDKWCKDRNMRNISYSYFLHRICELLGHNEYKIYFPMFNSKDRQHDYDQIWLQIKSHFRWHVFVESK